MNGTYSNTAETLRIAPGDMHELIRGQEQRLLERIAPLTREHNVWLDLHGVDRIDAAGIAALIALYTCAHNAGHNLLVINASPRVAEILSLVGLDRVLFGSDAVPGLMPETSLEQSAA